MKRSKIVSVIISILIIGLLFLTTYYILSDKGTDEYDIVIFGDSIVAGVYNPEKIPAYVEKYSGLSTLNAGFGGMGMSNIATRWLISDSSRMFSMANLSESVRIHDFSNQLMGTQKGNETVPEGWYETANNLCCVDWDSVKYIIIEHGANDYLTGMPIEIENDKFSVNSFAGALRTSIKNVKIGAPNAKIILTTPTYQWVFKELPDCHSYSFGGGTLDEYVNAEIEIAKEYGIYLIDNFHEIDLNEDNYEMYLLDGLHPNPESAEMIAKNIVKHLEEHDENS